MSTLAGLVICYLVSGVHTCHLLSQILGNLLIVSLLPSSWSHLASFAWCFSYLTFFRLSSRLGLPEPPAHTNAIILILTLKLVGLAFEVHDAQASEEKESKSKRPSVADTLHYCLGHIGLITGPYYKFSTWRGLHEASRNIWPKIMTKEDYVFSAIFCQALIFQAINHIIVTRTPGTPRCPG